ncbi:MAG: hypothetical protein NC311_13605 [Muribaculaceae bacterium]|nr:hypothetical protein [Muribaculaceae bacterium]
MRNSVMLYCRDMDGEKIYKGDRAVCFALPRSQPCVVQILDIVDDGHIRADNGNLKKVVPAESCILQAHAAMA